MYCLGDVLKVIVDMRGRPEFAEGSVRSMDGFGRSVTRIRRVEFLARSASTDTGRQRF